MNTSLVSTNLPTALISLAHLGLQDCRTGKVVAGIGLTVLGTSLLIFSGLPKNLNSRIWSVTNNESAPKSTVRWGMAAAALLIIMYGIYNIAVGILELTYSSTQLHKAVDDKIISQPYDEKACDLKIARGKKLFLSCPHARKLWNDVERNGGFTVRCGTDADAPVGAKVWVETRIIVVAHSNKEMVSPLLFELNNLKNAKGLSATTLNKCGIDIESYVRTVEELEYQTARATYEISNSCFKEGYWTQDLIQYHDAFNGKSARNDWSSFEGYLKSQEMYGHADLYRMEWYKKCNPEAASDWVTRNMDKWRAIYARAEKKKEL